MLKKDFTSLKKALKFDSGNIQKVWVVFANAQKDILLSSSKSFFSMTEEEQKNYSDILKKTITGKKGNTNIIVPFDTEEPVKGIMQDIVNSQDEDKIVSLMNEIVESYDSKGNFAVLLATVSAEFATYASDGTKYDDAGTIASFVVSCICPIKESKPTLAYRHQSDFLEVTKKDYILQNPEVGFVYPTLDNSDVNVNKLLYFAKKPNAANGIHSEIFEDILKLEVPTLNEEQQFVFHEALGKSFENLTIQDIEKINEDLIYEISESDKEGQDAVFNKTDLVKLLQRHGGQEVEVEDNVSINLENIVSDKFVISNGEGLSISSNQDNLSKIRQIEVNGVPSLVISLDGLDINGVRLK